MSDKTLKQKQQRQDKEKQAYAFYVAQGWTPEQSIGIIGNIKRESGFNPNAIGDAGKAFGLAQWHPDRQAKAKSLYGNNWKSFENQLKFIDWELKNTEKVAGDKLKKTKGVWQAGQVVSDFYERPKVKFSGDETRQTHVADLAMKFKGVKLTPEDMPYFDASYANSVAPYMNQVQETITPTLNYFDIPKETPTFASVPDSAEEKKETVEDGVTSKDVEEVETKTKEYNFLEALQNLQQEDYSHLQPEQVAQQQIVPQVDFNQQYEQVSQFIDEPIVAQQGGEQIGNIGQEAIDALQQIYRTDGHTMLGKLPFNIGATIGLANSYSNKTLPNLSDTLGVVPNPYFQAASYMTLYAEKERENLQSYKKNKNQGKDLNTLIEEESNNEGGVKIDNTYVPKPNAPIFLRNKMIPYKKQNEINETAIDKTYVSKPKQFFQQQGGSWQEKLANRPKKPTIAEIIAEGDARKVQQRTQVDNTKVSNYNNARVFNPNVRNKTDKEIAQEREAKIQASVEAQKTPYTRENWRQQLASETAATGDKLRVSLEPNFFDDYINPASMIGSMASNLGQAPLQAQQSDSILPYVTAIGVPLFMGAVGGLGAKTTGQFVNNMVNPLAGTGDLLKSGYSKGVNYLENQGIRTSIAPELREGLRTNGFEMFNLNSVRKPSGSIGNQGATSEGANSILNSLDIKVKGVNPNEVTLKEMVEHLKNNPKDAQKYQKFLEENPISVNELPGGEFHINDGHHRATLSYYSGKEEIPTIIKNKGEYTAQPSNNSFKSEVNWGNWNKEILDNPKLLNEYSTIEQTSKANGSWMKNSDGSTFQGTPEQFVQQNSENFKKAFPDGFEETYRGTIGIEPSTKKIRSNRAVFTADKELAKKYAGRNSVGEVLGQKQDVEGIPGIYQLAYPKPKNSLVFDSKGSQWDNLDFNKISLPDSKISEDLKKEMLLYNQPVRTDNIANFVENTNADNILIKNINDSGFGDVNIVNNKAGNYLKSLVGNNGMFDMNNPNIYKSIAPIAGASYLATQGQEESKKLQQGGSVKQDNEWLKNWYTNRVIPNKDVQGAYLEDKPIYTERLKNIPLVTKVNMIDNNPQKTGQYQGDTGKILMTPTAQPSVYTHEVNHYLNDFPSTMRTVHENVVEQNMYKKGDSRLGGNNEYYDYLRNPDEIHSRVQVLRKDAGFKPNEEVTQDKLLKYLQNYKGSDENILQLMNLTDEKGLLEMLNYMAETPKNKEKQYVAQQGGKQNYTENELAFLSEIQGIPVSSRGMYDYPNQEVIVPTNGSITMKGIPHKIKAKSLETGEEKILKPNREYYFKNTKNVLEIPFFKK